MNLTKLLSPISDDSPAGTDLSASGAIYELDRLIAGKPETQFGPAEEADWRVVREKCEELVKESKDLRVAVAYATALLRTKGLAGFASALQLIRGYLEQYWEPLYPRLDPDDDNDPQERVNTLSILSAPIGTAGDTYKVLASLRAAPITQSAQAGSWGLGAVIAAREGTPMLDGKPPPSSAVIDGAFSETPPDFLAATLASVTTALESAQFIQSYFTDTLSASAWPNFELLTNDLKRIQNLITQHQGGAAPSDDTSDSSTTSSRSGGGGGGGGGGGSRRPDGINSRDDVVRTLDLIIQYYTRHEPASPIPLMLERVKRQVPMTFVELIKDMTPDAMDRVTLITGFKPKEEY